MMFWIDFCLFIVKIANLQIYFYELFFWHNFMKLMFLFVTERDFWHMTIEEKNIRQLTLV